MTLGDESIFIHSQARTVVFEMIIFVSEIFSAEYGPKWIKDKKFLMSSVRSLGFGTASAEGKIQEEVDQLISRVIPKATAGQGGCDLADDMTCATASVICNIIYSQRYGPDDPELHRLVHMNRSLFDVEWRENWLLDSLPGWLTKLTMPGTYKKLKGRGDAMRQFLVPKIHQHVETHIPGQPRDFMDLYIDEKGVENLDYHVFAGTCISFLQDAIDTLASTICYVLLYVTSNDHIQRRIHQELDKVVGRDHRPTLSDRNKLPFLEATIQETLRLASPVAIIPTRSVRRNVTLQGYTIPKDCFVRCNLVAVHHDSKLFPDPHEFRPERFLDADGNLRKNDHLMPFGVGRNQTTCA